MLLSKTPPLKMHYFLAKRDRCEGNARANNLDHK